MKSIIRTHIILYLLFWGTWTHAQNNKIRCYFNHAVNPAIATGVSATYLNSTFPDTIAAYINRARYSIDIALYNYTAATGSNAAKIAVAANAAAARGVNVRWLYNASTGNTGLSLLSSAIVLFSSPERSGYIMHNKFMVIDINSPDTTDVITLTGSYNWSDQQATGDYNNMVFIQSKQVAMVFYTEFNKMWGGASLQPNASAAKFGTAKTPSTQSTCTVNSTVIEIGFSPKDSLGNRLERSILTADNDLFFGIYAFTDFSIADLIKTKYNNGVTVRGIMDQFCTSYNPYDILQPALTNNMLVLYGSNLYHNKTMLIDALNPESDPQVFTGSFNWTAQGQFSNDENVIIIHDAATANQYYQSLCKDFTSMGGIPCVAAPCPTGSVTVASNLRGSSYQWQLNSGTGFINIENNNNYSGVTTENLTLTNTPTSWYNYQYRCLVDGIPDTDTSTLRFTAYWNGSASTAWENPANWNCGVLPDGNTDVVIKSGVLHYPLINNNTTCRSVRTEKNSKAGLMPGVQLQLTGR